MIAASTFDRAPSAVPASVRATRHGSLAHLSSEDLLALVARGDDAALGELYDRFGRVAYGLAYRVLQDGGHAEDAVQDAFLQVWRSASGFAPERSSAKTWILMLVHRRAVDLVRRHERRRWEPSEEAPDTAAPGAEESFAATMERERVRDALRRLSDREREAIELVYYGGLTHSQLAERLGEPLGTIKSRMFRALARLAAILGEDDELLRRPLAAAAEAEPVAALAG